MNKKTWLDDVLNAFDKLNGIGSLKKIYDVIKQERGNLPPSYEAIIRRTIETNSSDSEAFSGKRDLFYSVDGIGSGVWGLRSAKDRILKDSISNNPAIYVGYDRVKLAITPEELQKRLEKLSRIGLIGEQIAVNYEIDRLVSVFNCNRSDAAKNIVSYFSQNVAKGYDIESKYENEIRYIEVKTTYDMNADIFFSINEYETLKKKGNEAWIYRIILNKLDNSCLEIIKVQNPFGTKTTNDFRPISFRCSINDLIGNPLDQ